MDNQSVEVDYATGKTADLFESSKILLYRRLTESGWTDTVRMKIRDEIKKSSDAGRGPSLEEITGKVLNEVRRKVPAAIKEELLCKLRIGLSEVYVKTEEPVE